jgi:acyl carrier protein
MGETIQETIRNFIIENFLFGDPGDFSDADSLLEKGIIDSTGVLELVAFLEKTYGIKVADEELVPENLDSVSNVVQYLSRKQAKQ